LLLAGKTLKLDCERRVQPTWARTAARQIVHLGLGDVRGTFHVSCRGETTWAGFVSALAERLGLPRNWEEIPSADLRAPAPRPPNCLFLHRNLEMHGFGPMPGWEQALDEYLAEASRARSASAGS